MFYFVCSRSSASDAQSWLKKKKKNGEKGVASPKTSEQKDTENKKTNDKELEKTVSNKSDGDGEPENDKNYTQASDNDEEKTDSNDSNGDATLKQDTKKTGAVGNNLESTVMKNGDVGMNYKTQLQMKLMVKVRFNRMQRTRLGLLETNLKKLLQMKVKEL